MNNVDNESDDDLEKAWQENPRVIRGFTEKRPNYEELCNEVAYILKKRLKEKGLKIAAVTHRAKTLESFVEKLGRKEYSAPFDEVTDLAGVRIVYLYKSDHKIIESIITSEFEVREIVDKIEQKNDDQFGYGALHYLITLNNKNYGARYDDLQGLVCEIQVRTILQDAWAVVAHHLSYKQDSDVPKELKRKLNSLSGLFETADDHFELVRAGREKYLKVVLDKMKRAPKTANEELNLDTFTEFLKLHFGDKRKNAQDTVTSRVLKKLNSYGYENLDDVRKLLEETKEARSALDKAHSVDNATGEVARAMAFKHPDYKGLSAISSQFIKDYRASFISYDQKRDVNS